MPSRVIAIEDHPLMLKAVVEELEGKPDIEVVGAGNHGFTLIALINEKIPDVVILDLGMSSGPFCPIFADNRVFQVFIPVHFLTLTGYDNHI